LLLQSAAWKETGNLTIRETKDKERKEKEAARVEKNDRIEYMPFVNKNLNKKEKNIIVDVMNELITAKDKKAEKIRDKEIKDYENNKAFKERIESGYNPKSDDVPELDVPEPYT
jgi:hypothetical protein